jgi:SpoVK/Ycf46/Vps4 family AAA+-type ATPase
MYFIALSKGMSKTTEQNHKNTYVKNYEVLSAAAVGVVLTRTKEPHRCADALKEWAFTNHRTFRVWNTVTGWTEIRPNEITPQPPDRVGDIFTAVKKIDDVDGGGVNKWDNSVSVIHYPHWVLPKHPPLIQLLKDYSRKFPETKQRVVLLCPEGTTLPRELENDIPILDFELPGKEELREVFDMVMQSVSARTNKTAEFNEDDINLLLSSGSGMTESEFETALSKAFITHRDAWPNIKAEQINSVLLEVKTEVIKRSEVLELMPSTDMSEVGGMEELKDWIGKRKNCFSEEAKNFGVDVPKGIAAIGPPGTGKSLVAKAISSVLGMPLIRFDVSKVFGSLVGQSEERVRAALKQLDACAPCIALIDEVDKAGIDPRQAGGDSGTSKRVMGAILTHMQETSAPVFWILTANRVGGLPPELLRKGRLDEVFAVLPPNRKERLDVLKIHLKKRKQDPDKIKDLQLAVDVSEGFVSAEIEAGVKEAVVEAFHKNEPVTGHGIALQLKNMKPISEAFADDFNEMKTWAQQNARLASSPEPVNQETSPRRVRRRVFEGE